MQPINGQLLKGITTNHIIGGIFKCRRFLYKRNKKTAFIYRIIIRFIK